MSWRYASYRFTGHILFLCVALSTFGCSANHPSAVTGLGIKAFSALEGYPAGTFIHMSSDGYPEQCQSRDTLKERFSKEKRLIVRDGPTGHFFVDNTLQTGLFGAMPHAVQVSLQGNYSKVHITDFNIEKSHIEGLDRGVASLGPWLRSLDPVLLRELSSDILDYCGTSPSYITEVLVVEQGSYTLKWEDGVGAEFEAQVVQHNVQGTGQLTSRNNREAHVQIIHDTRIGYRDVPLPVDKFKRARIDGIYPLSD